MISITVGVDFTAWVRQLAASTCREENFLGLSRRVTGAKLHPQIYSTLSIYKVDIEPASRGSVTQTKHVLTLHIIG